MTKRFISDDEMKKLVEQNYHIYSDYFDPGYAISLVKNIFKHLDHHYFRLRFIGFEDYPERNNPDRPLIFASNHSGMAFPWDAIMFNAGLLQRNQYDFKKSVRTLVAPPLTKFRLMNVFLVKDFWRRAGGIEATTLNFETMMQYRDSNVMIYPEGVPGIGKGFNHRYQLQPFATSFVRMSLKYKTDIIPIYTINGEYINPFVFSIKPINKLTSKIGIPFLPIGLITLLLLFFPFLLYFAFPAQLTYVMGKRIKPYEMIDKRFENITPEEIRKLRDRVQQQMQQEMNEAVKKYGKRPYKVWELLKNNFGHFRKIPFFNAPGWPLLFLEHERLYQKHHGKPVDMNLGLASIIKTFIMNPVAWFFFIPVIGWIPIIWLGYKSR